MILLQTAASTDWMQAIFGSQYFFIIATIAIVYFMIIRPQRKRQKEIDNFRKGLTAGQEVVTSGGIYGKIKEINDNIVTLEVAHNVNIRVDKSTIFANPTPANWLVPRCPTIMLSANCTIIWPAWVIITGKANERLRL